MRSLSSYTLRTVISVHCTNKGEPFRASIIRGGPCQQKYTKGLPTKTPAYSYICIWSQRTKYISNCTLTTQELYGTDIHSYGYIHTVDTHILTVGKTCFYEWAAGECGKNQGYYHRNRIHCNIYIKHRMDDYHHYLLLLLIIVGKFFFGGGGNKISQLAFNFAI